MKAVLGALFVALVFPVHGKAGSTGISPSGEAAKETIRSRSFGDRRDLVTYLEELPEEFARQLSSLSPRQRILDAGAGAIYFAEELVTLRKLGKRAEDLKSTTAKRMNGWLKKTERPEVVAISLNLEREVPKHSGLNVIWGRFFAEIPDQELGKFDLIVDLQGIFAYSPAADDVLRKYLRILQPGGSLFLSLGKAKTGFAYRCQVKNKGKSQSLAQWVGSIPHLSIRPFTGGSGKTAGDYRTLQILKVPGKTAEIPSLSLMGIDTSKEGPPTRIYWESTKTAALSD